MSLKQDGRPVLINLNDQVCVRLTKLGKDVFKVEFCRAGESFREQVDASKALAERLQTDGTHRFTVWELMAYFGQAMHRVSVEGASALLFAESSILVL